MKYAIEEINYLFFAIPLGPLYRMQYESSTDIRACILE